MENNSLETPIEKIEFLIEKLVDFSNENEFNYKLYKSFAKESGKTFNRYFSEIEDQTIKEKIISDLKTDFKFSIDDIVINMLSKPINSIENFESGVTYPIGRPIPDNRTKDYKNNYKQLIELFLNSVDIELKQPQQTKINKPNSRNDIFVDNAIELFKYYYDCKNMVNSSRVDFRFLYEVMKEDGYIHDTVTLGQYITFIRKDFGYVDEELKVINMDSKPNLNRLNDYKRYEKQTITTNIKKQP